MPNPSSSTNPSPSSLSPCTFFKKGRCMNGIACRLAHVDPPPPPPTNIPKPRKKSNGNKIQQRIQWSLNRSDFICFTYQLYGAHNKLSQDIKFTSRDGIEFWDQNLHRWHRNTCLKLYQNHFQKVIVQFDFRRKYIKTVLNCCFPSGPSSFVEIVKLITDDYLQVMSCIHIVEHKSTNKDASKQTKIQRKTNSYL